MELFTEEEDEMLIKLVSQHPLLYNLSMEDYKNTRKKDKIWFEIGKKLNKRSDNCKKHWKNLKDTYLRQKRKLNSGTGLTAPKNPRSKFSSYMKLFSFLESVSYERATVCKIDPDEIIAQESQSSVVSTQDGSPLLDWATSSCPLEGESTQSYVSIAHIPASAASPSAQPAFSKSNDRKRKKMEDVSSYLHQCELSRQKILQLNMYQKNEDDELVSFSEHVRMVLRKLKPVRKLQAKKEIFDILMKYELLDVESDIDREHAVT